MLNIKGKWALITGSSRGIGFLAAIEMAKQGCNLVLHARKKENCEKILKAVKEYGIEAFAVEAELSNLEDVEKMLKEIDSLVDVSIVLNNAGLQIGYRSEYLLTPIEDYDISFKINTIAPMYICYHYLPKMIKNNFGRIVNTTSGIDKEPEQAGYSASKAALDKVTKDIATKLNGTNVTISLADPGWCRTDLGGPKAPNDPSFALPGVILGVFVTDGISGRLFSAGDYSGLSISDALLKIK